MGKKENVLIVVAIMVFVLLAVTAFLNGQGLPQYNYALGDTFTGGIIAGDAQPPGCEDSDGGVEPLIAGRIVVGQQVRSDYCISERVLKEWRCEAGAADSVFVPCDGNICSDGRCGA